VKGEAGWLTRRSIKWPSSERQVTIAEWMDEDEPVAREVG